MKSNTLPTVYFSLHAYTGMHSSIPGRSVRAMSPYLRAILSAKAGNSSASRFEDNDRQAAIRYIKESRTRIK